ncbi:MAG: response regulator [Deltaproteobacteria bacterium]|nr:MAG: response regulator [Deltaproteobacteria bacterium]
MRRRVLIIDDEPLAGESLRRLLEDTYAVDLVSSAEAAWERLKDDDGYHAVVCDLMMPGMTGMELHARVARERPRLARRFVFLTGGAFTQTAQSFLEATDSPILEKPYDLDELYGVLDRVSG